MPAGRPLKFKSPEELLTAAETYFAMTPIGVQCVTGLAIHLGTSRKILWEYQGRDKFRNAITALKTRIEHAYEMRGITRGNGFDIFALKNMGWKDQQTTDHVSSDGSLGPSRIEIVAGNGNSED